jgi:hypothetical protein
VLVASALGLVGLLIGAAMWGAPGAAWGLGVAQHASGIGQTLVLLAVWRAWASRELGL